MIISPASRCMPDMPRCKRASKGIESGVYDSCLGPVEFAEPVEKITVACLEAGLR